MAQTGRPARRGALGILARRGRQALRLTRVQPAAPDRLAARVPRDLWEQPVDLDRPVILGRGATSELESPDQPAALGRLVPRVALGLQEDLVIPGRLV